MKQAPVALSPRLADGQRVAADDVTFCWQCAREADRVEFQGALQNARRGAAKFMALELADADSHDRHVSAVTTAIHAVMLQAAHIGPFVVRLRPSGGESRFDLCYRSQVHSALGAYERPRSGTLDDGSATQHRFAKRGPHAATNLPVKECRRKSRGRWF